MNNEKIGNYKTQKKVEALILMIILYFLSLLFSVALFALKMVVSIAVKSARKILYPWRLLGTKI